MKVICCKIFKINFAFLLIIFTASCNKNSDLIVEYVPSETLQKEELDNLLADDYLNAVPLQSILSNSK